MKREEAIEILELQISNAEFFARYTNNDKDAEKELKYAEAFRMAIESLSDEVTRDWIPCSEELPKTMGEYLITVLSNPSKNPISSAAFYSISKKEFGMFKPSGEWEKWDVVAWMPRPKPYKGGEDE